MNGGAIASNGEPATTPVYSATNGGWNSATGVFTPTSGNPSLTVTVGDFAHVFTDGSTTPTFIGRVTAVSSTTITVSTTAKSGTAPTTAGTGISINVGGAWAGPSGTTIFPFGFVTNTLTDASTNRPRINLKNNQSHALTASMVHTNAGPIKWQGYTTSFADGGRTTVDGGTSGASYILLSVSNANQNWFEDFIFQNNGATGTSSLVAMTTGGNAVGYFRRCVFANSRGHGLEIAQGVGGTALECEAYGCNQSNTANLGGIALTAIGARAIRCISHDHTAGVNAHGFIISSSAQLIECIGESCSGSGAKLTAGGSFVVVKNSDFYNNTGDGFLSGAGGGASNLCIENSNFVKNGGYGINIADASTIFGLLTNNGFGAGTQANTSGQINYSTGTDSIEISGSVTYPNDVTPWVDPANGDFRINLTAAKDAGRGGFTQTAVSYAGAIGYPDIGAAQHQDTGGGGSSGIIVNLGMRGGMN